MGWLDPAADKLREFLSQAPMLDAWQPTIAQMPDWALLAAGPIFAVLLSLLTWILMPHRQRARRASERRSLEPKLESLSGRTPSPPLVAAAQARVPSKRNAVPATGESVKSSFAREDFPDVATAKTFRIFVSSTFADFGAERRILHEEVFPSLDAYCSARGFRFQPIDMRWGINAEAHNDQRTAELCLGEVVSCIGGPPPNFLAMIGQRYGWLPLPNTIPSPEFQEICQELEDSDARVLKDWYLHDENAVVRAKLTNAETADAIPVTAYVLRSRFDATPEFRSAGLWDSTERQLREALQSAAISLIRKGQLTEARADKYFASITEQEIALGIPAGGAQPSIGVFAVIREIADPDAGRSPNYVDANPRLDALKSRVRTTLGASHLIAVEPRGDFEELNSSYARSFAREVQSRLEAAIDRHIAIVDAAARMPNAELVVERQMQRTVRMQKLRACVPRDAGLLAINEYVLNASRGPFVVHGRSGLGKSTLVASAISEQERGTGGAHIVYRFAGTSAASSSLRSLLISIAEDLGERGLTPRIDGFERDASLFNAQIRTMLSSVTGRLTLFVDALDQLGDSADLTWLPSELPEGVKLVLSTLSDQHYEIASHWYSELRRRTAPEDCLEVHPLAPQEARQVLSNLGIEAARTLRPAQMDYILAGFERAGGSPLWLHTAFAIARSWRSRDIPGEERFCLAPSVRGLIEQFILELSDVHHHDRTLVLLTLGYLAAAEHGLSETELLEVLSRDHRVLDAVATSGQGTRLTSVPYSVWVRLYRDLAPFITQKLIHDELRIQFYHREVLAVVADLHAEDSKSELHRGLATYFKDSLSHAEPNASAKHALAELPYQLHAAGDVRGAGELLQSSAWLYRKLATLGVDETVRDYRYAETDSQRLIGRVLELAANTLSVDPTQLCGQVLGRLQANDAEGLSDPIHACERELPRPSIAPVLATFSPPGAEVRRFFGHFNSVDAIAVVGGRKFVSAGFSADAPIKCWDLEKGIVERTFGSRRLGCRALAALDDQRFVSVNNDGLIQAWTIDSDHELFQLQGKPAKGGTFKARCWLIPVGSGHVLWIVGDEGELQCWDLTTKSLAWDCRLPYSVNEVARVSDDLLAFAADGKEVKLWRISDRGTVATFSGHEMGVSCVAVVDSQRIASGSWDKTIRVWDINGATEVARLTLQDHPVALLALDPARIVSATGGKDTSVAIFEWRTGKKLEQLTGHTFDVTGFAQLDSARFLTSSEDATIRLWDVDSPVRVKRSARASSARVLGARSKDLVLSSSEDGLLAVGSAEALCLGDDARKVAEGVISAGFLTDQRVAALHSDGHLSVYDLQSGDQVSKAKFADRKFARMLAIDPERVALVASDGSLAIAQPYTGNLLVECAGSTAIRRLRRLSAAMLATISGDNTIRVWDVTSGQEKHRLDGADGLVAMEALDESALVIADKNHVVRVLQLNARSEGFDFLRPPDAAEMRRGVVRRGFATLKDIFGMKGASRLLPDPSKSHDDAVTDLTVLDGGRAVVSASADRTLRLWDVASGSQLAWFEGDCSFVEVIHIPDSSMVLARDELRRLHLLTATC
jgi:WD40 repeat protein